MAESETGIVSSKSYTRVLPAKMKTSALRIKHEHKCSCGKYFTIIQAFFYTNFLHHFFKVSSQLFHQITRWQTPRYFFQIGEL